MAELHTPIDAYAYVRFSSDNQREESIEAQIRAIKIYAKQVGYNIIHYYKDRAKTGKNTNRPGFMEMMEDIRSGKDTVQAVLVHKLDRFSRNTVDSLHYSQELKDHGVKLTSVMENLDDSPSGNLMRLMITGINAFYVENLANETMKGLKENAHKCLTTGGTPPLGYDLVDKKYVINPTEAEAVFLLFKMYDEGYGYLKIIKELTMLGYKTKRGKPFGKNSLYELFRNEKYKGVYTYNKAQKRKRDGSRSRVQKPEDEVIRYPGGVPAIVSEEVWDRVNAKMERNRRRPGAGKAKQIYLLSGLIYCGECGYAMHGNARKPAPNRNILVTYRCNHKENNAACCNREIKRDVVDGFVMRGLEKYFFNDDIIPTLTKQLNTYIQTSKEETDSKADKLLDRRTELEKQKANIIEAVTKTGFQDIFTAQLVSIEQELTALREQLESSQKRVIATTITEDMVREYLGTVRQFIKQRDLPQIKNFINSYVERVEVYQEHVKVTFKVAFSFFQEQYKDEVYSFSVEVSREKKCTKKSA